MAGWHTRTRTGQRPQCFPRFKTPELREPPTCTRSSSRPGSGSLGDAAASLIGPSSLDLGRDRGVQQLNRQLAALFLGKLPGLFHDPAAFGLMRAL